MAILKGTPCGGVLLDDEIFDVVEDVITVQGAVPILTTTAMCGVLLDGSVFEVLGEPYNFVITSTNRLDDNVTATVTANCGGLVCDARFFSLKDDGSLSFREGFFLTLNVIPADASVVVNDGEKDIEPFEQGKHIYLLEDGNATYTWTVSKSGYKTETGQVTASENKIIEVNLTTE